MGVALFYWSLYGFTYFLLLFGRDDASKCHLVLWYFVVAVKVSISRDMLAPEVLTITQ